jgi:hypothetical protein
LAEVLTRVYNMLEVLLLHKESLNNSKMLEQALQEAVASRDRAKDVGTAAVQPATQIAAFANALWHLASNAG